MILVVTILIILLYTSLIISFTIGFDLVKSVDLKNDTAKNSFSILIPFRNEAAELPILLESILQLNYLKDKYEIIFVNDESDDESVEIIENYIKQPFDCHTRSVQAGAQGDIKVIENNRKTNSPKKDAINTAIHKAKFDWIITTDADCDLPQNWLLNFDAFIQKNKPKLIVAPITYSSNGSFLERFQHLDFLSLQGSTIGGFGIKKPFLCNGANLCYNKQAFIEVNGFEGNSTIASGDDIFLLEKIIEKHPKDVHYLKSNEATVITKPQSTFNQLLGQRVRWTAKSTAYNNTFSKLVSTSVLMMNTLLIILFFSSLFSYTPWQLFLITFGIKFIVDLLLLFRTVSFFKQQKILLYYFLSSLIYPVFIMFVVIVSFSSGYSWKGRQFKK